MSTQETNQEELSRALYMLSQLSETLEEKQSQGKDTESIESEIRNLQTDIEALRNSLKQK